MVFIIDFDGTIALKDTIDALLEKYARGDYLQIETQWQNGEISTQTCLAKQLAMVVATPTEILNFFNAVKIDSGFKKFQAYAQAIAKLAIVSDGLDQAITTVLKNTGSAAIEVFSNQLIPATQGIGIAFPYAKSSDTAKNEAWKATILKKLVAQYGGPSIMIGDGRSDFAAIADIVFAKNSLIKYCQEKSIAHYSFKNFSEILQTVKKW